MQQEPTNGTASAGAVYVQTNAAPNEVIAFRRATDGSLDRIGSVATGGEGDGTPHLQSQGSVTLTDDGQYLLVTNAASDDLSVFSVAADGSIELLERVHTGSTPRSVDESEGLVVVLNNGEPGLVSFRVDAEGVARVEGGDQALDTSDADPAQVAFSPDGSMVVITQRGTDSIVTYEVTDEGTFGVLLAEGRSTGRLSARYRAANFPRKRSDGALVPEFRGVLETDDGGVILFEWQGLAVLSASGMRQLLGSLVHTTDDPRYRWLNDRVCAVEGEVRPRTNGSGFDVALEVSEMVWEGLA